MDLSHCTLSQKNFLAWDCSHKLMSIVLDISVNFWSFKIYRNDWDNSHVWSCISFTRTTVQYMSLFPQITGTIPTKYKHLLEKCGVLIPPPLKIAQLVRRQNRIEGLWVHIPCKIIFFWRGKFRRFVLIYRSTFEL